MRLPLSPFAIAVGIGAGLASALCFAAPTAGTSLAMPLFLFSALPIVIASLGWGTVVGLVALVVDALVLGVFFNAYAALTHILLSPLPAVVLSHILGLSRPADPARPEAGMVWFPLGTWLMIAVGLVGAGTLIAGWIVGIGDRPMVEALTQALMAGPHGAADEPSVRALAAFLVALMPVFSPAIWLIIVLANLWAGAHVTRLSERLARPWDDIAAVVVPRQAAAALFVLGGVVIGVGGVPGLIAAPFFGALLALKLLLGFAAIHMLTRGLAGRRFLLTLAWTSLILSIPALPILLLGIADVVLRLKFWRRPT